VILRTATHRILARFQRPGETHDEHFAHRRVVTIAVLTEVFTSGFNCFGVADDTTSAGAFALMEHLEQ
jgi:hypothetical protein